MRVREQVAAAIVRSLLPDAEIEVLPGVRDGSAGYEPEAARRAIGYEPAYALREGLRRTVAAGHYDHRDREVLCLRIEGVSAVVVTA